MQNSRDHASHLKRLIKKQEKLSIFLMNLKWLESIFKRYNKPNTPYDDLVQLRARANVIINRLDQKKFDSLSTLVDLSYGNFAQIHTYESLSIVHESSDKFVIYDANALTSQMNMYEDVCAFYRTSLRPEANKLYNDVIYVAYVAKFNLPSELQLEIMKHIHLNDISDLLSIESKKVFPVLEEILGNVDTLCVF